MQNLGGEYLEGANNLRQKRDELRKEREKKRGSPKLIDRRINVLSEEIRYMENVGSMLISEAEHYKKREMEGKNDKISRRL